MKQITTLKTVTCAMLCAVGVLLPQVFHSIPSSGTLISPMHIPVLLCGFLCGSILGAICGFLTPVLSFLLTQMPPFPNALVPMTFELVTYGILSGVFYNLFLNSEKTSKVSLPLALICSMVGGRIVFVLVRCILFSILTPEAAFSAILVASLAGAFVSCWIGIVSQIVLIPAIMFALKKGHILEKYQLC